MPSAGWPQDYHRIVLDSTDSTMQEAARRAAELPGPTWIMARRQTAGHGRRGRPWIAPEGNFAATLLMRPTGSAGEAALRSFVAANALRLTLAEMIDPQRLSLKWPNDVLLDGSKVAGILLESAGDGRGVAWLAVGIGINLVAAPEVGTIEPGALHPVSVAGQGGTPLSLDRTLDRLARHFADQEHLLTAFGFAPVRALWLDHAARLGQPVRARTVRDEIHGVFRTVDEAGNLVLETQEGRVAIPAAEVYF